MERAYAPPQRFIAPFLTAPQVAPRLPGFSFPRLGRGPDEASATLPVIAAFAPRPHCPWALYSLMPSSQHGARPELDPV